jgi:hypothetical protein
MTRYSANSLKAFVFLFFALGIATLNGSTKVTSALIECNPDYTVAGQYSCSERMNMLFVFFETKQFKDSLTLRICDAAAQVRADCPAISNSNFKIRELSKVIYDVQYTDYGDFDGASKLASVLDLYLAIYDRTINGYSESKDTANLEECEKRSRFKNLCKNFFATRYIDHAVANVQTKPAFKIVDGPYESREFIVTKVFLIWFLSCVTAMVFFICNSLWFVIVGRENV